jgi:hypothetical protein
MTKQKMTKHAAQVKMLGRKRDRAIARLVAAWQKYENSVEDDDAADELEAALDLVTLANVVHTFEWASGPHER